MTVSVIVVSVIQAMSFQAINVSRKTKRVKINMDIIRKQIMPVAVNVYMVMCGTIQEQDVLVVINIVGINMGIVQLMKVGVNLVNV